MYVLFSLCIYSTCFSYLLFHCVLGEEIWLHVVKFCRRSRTFTARIVNIITRRTSGWGRSHEEIRDVALWLVPHAERPWFHGPLLIKTRLLALLSTIPVPLLSENNKATFEVKRSFSIFFGNASNSVMSLINSLEFPRETGLILRCAGKVRNPFQTKQGNRPSRRDQEGPPFARRAKYS